MDETVAALVRRFELEPHPEGGYFREVYRSSVTVKHPGIPAGDSNERRGGSLIYFLLGRDDFSAFHRVRWTDEIWHLYAGGPIELHLLDPHGTYSRRALASDLAIGEPTTVVPAGWWQAARLAPGCAWAFGGCTVAPGFEFADFEMPPRARLVEQYPEQAGIITSLTRG
jgi:predicted cupin superfamily sugar epimerase